MITNLSIPCVWGGQLAGILLKNSAATTISGTTKKIIGVHGWLDNLSSLLPLAQKLVDRHPSECSAFTRRTHPDLLQWVDYEICLYDRAGHGFSNHLPKGSDYSYACNLRDLRTITQGKFDTQSLADVTVVVPPRHSSRLDGRQMFSHRSQLWCTACHGGNHTYA